MDRFLDRRHRLAPCFASESLDALLISNPNNVSYLTGFSGEASWLIVGHESTLLVTDGRFTQQLAEECPGLELHVRPPSQTVPDAVAEVLNKLGLRSVGFETSLTVAEFETITKATPTIMWKGGGNRVEELRMVKDATEIEQIREAIHMAERAFAMFRAMLRETDSEKDLCDALEGYIRRAGGKCGSFPSIVAAGARAALPHAPPTKKAVADAELLLVDWGASGPFYKSDLTRILVPSKNSSRHGKSRPEKRDDKLREIYAVVLRAQEQALRAVRAGVKASDVDNAARSVVAEAGYGEHFNHGLGHGIGLQVHEAPLLKPGSEVVLKAGVVVTIEPGIYLPQWGGIRIEDDVLVTEDGCEVLSSVPKQLEEMMVDLR